MPSGSDRTDAPNTTVMPGMAGASAMPGRPVPSEAPEAPGPTPYPDVNDVLRYFLARIRAILGDCFRGMYLDGSLALGDYNLRSSDIDFVVVSDTDVPDDLFAALRDMHARFDASGSPWATEVEAFYVSQEAVRRYDPAHAHCPRIERGESLVMQDLDSGWVFHCHVLREHGIAVAGPDPRPLIDPVDPQELRQAVAAIAELWLEEALHDRDALRRRGPLTYMVVTLCRMLYTLDSGAVAPKPVAARWARRLEGGRWAALIDRALSWQKDPAYQDVPEEGEIDDALALIAYTLGKCRS